MSPNRLFYRGFFENNGVSVALVEKLAPLLTRAISSGISGSTSPR